MFFTLFILILKQSYEESTILVTVIEVKIRETETRKKLLRTKDGLEFWPNSLIQGPLLNHYAVLTLAYYLLTYFTY